MTIREKWEKSLGVKCSFQTQKYLSGKYPLKPASGSVFITSNYCPSPQLVAAILKLGPGEALYHQQQLVACVADAIDTEAAGTYKRIDLPGNVLAIHRLWDIYSRNEEAMQLDFQLLTNGRASAQLSNTVTIIGDRNKIFLEEGAKAEACILNSTAGPVYIGHGAEIMEGSMVRGPFALCEHSVIKMGAKVYGATTIGPHCKVGGEVSNIILFGYSNKAHDGFIGNSVIGEWCNLGADTNSSNLKNNYAPVKLFSYAENVPVDTGLQFCGLIMGDHCKTGINTMFNTGTMVGVGCNIYGGGFPPTAIPNFSWGGSDGFVIYNLDKLIETAEKVYARRGLKYDEQEKALMAADFDNTV
jgi:UDP-N-acetylglucosamine diphosphorylase/glucosamine-1-phosphate N-acetyltransferase